MNPLLPTLQFHVISGASKSAAPSPAKVLAALLPLLWLGILGVPTDAQAAVRGAPSVVFSVEPEEDGNLVYLPIVAPTADEAGSLMFGLRMRIANNEPTDVTLSNIRLIFTYADQALTAYQFPRDLPIGSGDTKTEYLEKDETVQLSGVAPVSVRVELSFDGYGTPVTLQRPLAAYRAPVPSGRYLFPGNDKDLGTDEYFSHIARHTGGSQFYGYDLHVQAWNGSRFSSIKAGGDSGNNEDRVGWNVPIYAMAEGVVLQANTGWEDNPAPGVRAIQRMGEHTGPSITDVKVTRLSATRAVSVVRRPAGNLRITVWDTEDNGREIHERGSINGDTVKAFAADALTGNRLVTAVRTPDDQLRVIVWGISDDGNSITRLGERDAAAIDEVAMIKLSSNRFATATRQADGNLRLIVWEASDDGLSLSLLDHDFAGTASSVSAVALSDSRVGVSLRNGSGNLQIIIWDLENGPALVRRGDVTGDPVTKAACVKTAGDRLVTAMRTAGGNLKVVRWIVSEDGETVSQELSEMAGQIQDLTAPVADGGTLVFTPVITQNGTLKTILWKEPDTDDGENPALFYRFGEREAGATDRIDADSLDGPLIFSGVRTASGDLKVITWRRAGGGGNSFVILHGNCRVLYAHFREGSLNPAIAYVGARVAPGQFLGRMGNSGSSSGPHTHIHAERVSSFLSVPEVIELETQGALPLQGFRPIPFHCAKAMRLSDIQPGGVSEPSNAFSDMAGHGVYFEQYGVKPAWLDEVYVDWASHCLAPTGRPQCTPLIGFEVGGPFSTVNQALAEPCWGYKMFIRAGSYGESVLLDRPMTINAYEGPAVVGQ